MSFNITLMYIAFFGLIAFTVYFTGSSWGLLGLALMPSYNSSDE